MKFIYFYGLCCFFICHKSKAIQVEGETFANQTTTPRNRPNLVNLNLDVQLLIFEHLCMNDQLILAEADARLSFAVEDILRRKLARKKLIFQSPYKNYTQNVPEHLVSEYNDKIEIENLPTVTRLLEKFGHLWSNLVIKHDYDDMRRRADEELVFKLVNSHCSKTLSQLHIMGKPFPSFSSSFRAFDTPFEAVEHLILEKRFTILNSMNLSFGQIFPAIKSLILQDFAFECPTILDEHYPHLTAFKAYVSDIHGVMYDFKYSAFKTFITNNLQIRTLNLRCVDPGLLQWISNALPHLENLTLDYYSRSSSDKNKYNIHFEHLKRLELFKNWYSLPSNTSFENLEEFIIDDQPLSSKNYIQPIKRCRKLKKIRLIRDFTDKGIIELADAKPSAVEIELYIVPEVAVDSLVKLVQNSENLKKLLLIANRNSFSNINGFIERFSDEWIISVAENGKKICLEKKDQE